MAITVIGGLITSTLLTLLVVPVAYTFLDAVPRMLSSASTSRTGTPYGVVIKTCTSEGRALARLTIGRPYPRPLASMRALSRPDREDV